VLVGRQRELIRNGGIVVEGRDIGPTIWPTTAVKIFLTAPRPPTRWRWTPQKTR